MRKNEYSYPVLTFIHLDKSKIQPETNLQVPIISSAQRNPSVATSSVVVCTRDSSGCVNSSNRMSPRIAAGLVFYMRLYLCYSLCLQILHVSLLGRLFNLISKFVAMLYKLVSGILVLYRSLVYP